MGNLFTDTYGGNSFSSTHGSGGNLFTDTYGSSFVGGGGGGPVHKKKDDGFFSGVLDVAENAAGQASDIVHAIPNAVVHTGEALAYDFGKGGTQSLSEAWKDPHGLIGGVVRPQVEAVKQDATALRRGDWHYFEKHPLNPVLDAVTLLSVGGKGALMAGKTGALGERAAALSKGERTLTVNDHTERLNQSRTLQGRIRQSVFDRYSEANPGMRVVGADVRMVKILTRRSATMTLRAGLPVRAFQRVTNKLEVPEVFAYHVAAEGVPLDDRILFYQAQLAGASKATRPLEQYLSNLMAPEVRDVLENPRPQFIEALQAGKDLEAKAGERLVQAGSLSEETRAERAGLPQRVMLDASSNQTYYHVAPKSARASIEKHGLTYRLGGGEGSTRMIRHNKGNYVWHSLEDAWRHARNMSEKPKQDVPFDIWEVHPSSARFAKDQASPGLTMLGRKDAQASVTTADIPPSGVTRISTERLSKVPLTNDFTRLSEAASPSLGINLVHPDFPAPFRFPHVGKKGNAGLFTTPKTSAMLTKAKPLDQLRFNAAVRLRNALLLTNPEQVLSADFLQTMRHENVIQMQREALDPISKPLIPDSAGTGFKEPSEWYYRPSYDRKQTASITRPVRESEALTHDQMILHESEALKQDQMIVNTDLARTSAEQAGQGVVSEDLRGLGIDARDAHDLERLQELGVRRVPAAFGKNFAKEFGGTSRAIRFFVDRPMDVWRAITLNYRPAWAVNNFIGNGLMGLATYGVDGAAAYLRVLLATERGEDKVLRLKNYTMRIPKLRRKYGRVFDEVAPQLHSAGLYGTQTRITHPGVYEKELTDFNANPALRKLGFVPKKVGRGVLAIGHGVTKVEILLAEDTSREAAFLVERGADLAKIQRTAKKMGEGNLKLADALKRLDRDSVEAGVRGVNDALGDFNDLNHAERAYLRRVIPFYSWFKVITKVSGKYVARYPARVLLLKNIADAQDRKGEPQLPEWLGGAVLIGGEEGGVQTLLSTQGTNPFETLNQVATGGAGGVLNPFLNSAVIGMTGRNPAFGGQQDYYGIGANTRGGWLGQAEMFAGSFLDSLAPVRLYGQTSGPYRGKLYAPKTYGHVGPVPLNDFVLQYLGIPIRHVKVNEARRESGLK